MLGLFKTFDGGATSKKSPSFPYDFATSGFERIDHVRFMIEDQPEWDYCFEKKAAIESIGRAAKRFGFGPNFGEEERVLCRLLYQLNAGPSIATYAWGLYHDLMTSAREGETIAA